MTEHTPELGQWAFSNTEFLEHEVSELTQATLCAISYEIERVMGNITQEPYRIGSNYGNTFYTDAFVMRDYCWCDGEREGHEDGCPPNFQWSNIKINWYKHLGRGMSANAPIPPDMVAEMLDECLASIRAKEAEYD